VKNTHRLTEGAVLLAIYAVLLLITIYVPVLGLVSTWVLVLPFIYFSWKNDWNGIVIFFIASLVISLIIGSILAIPTTILFGTTGITLGYLTKKGMSRMTILLATTLVFLVNVIAQYGAAVVFFEFNFVKEINVLMNESLNNSYKMMEAIGGPNNNIDTLKEQIDLMIKMIQLLLPSMLVVGSFFIVFLLQLINFPILKRFGLAIPKWQAFREIVLPKSILWYYLLAMLLSIILKPEEGSYLNTALWNVNYILQILLVVQGLSLIYFVSHLKGWSKAIPILATVFMFLVPIVLYIIRILGIIDLGFELRKRLVKK
jgi:uncharacterized protein YybS (DUF2232 family)